MTFLRVVLCQVLLQVPPCFASRDPSTPFESHPAVFGGPGDSSVLSEHVEADRSKAQSAGPDEDEAQATAEEHSSQAGSKEPPKPDVLDQHIAAGGPLESKIKQADDEARALEKAAKEWSDTSREIEGMSKNVVAEANKGDKDLEQEGEKAKEKTEAGVKGELESEKSKGGEGNSSLLSLGDEGSTEAPDDGTKDISTLIGSMNATYGQIQGLLQNAETKAKEAKETATQWASRPQQELQRKAHNAYRVVDSLTATLKTGHDRVSREVAIGALLPTGAASEDGAR